MSSVYFDPSVGGNGTTVTDDSNATTGLANGGHRTRFVPALSQVVAVAQNTVTQATAAANSATASANSATASANSATDASNSATAAANSATGLIATSTTSLAIPTVFPQAMTFTTQSGKQFQSGQSIKAASASAPANYVFGTVTSYSTTSLVISASQAGGTGSVNDWNISVAGVKGAKGDQGSSSLSGTASGAVEWNGTVTLASAATVDIGAAASNDLIISGTTTITSFGTKAAGSTRKIKASDSFTITHNATSLICKGNQNITTKANDVFQMTSLGGGNWIMDYYARQDGTQVGVSSGSNSPSTGSNIVLDSSSSRVQSISATSTGVTVTEVSATLLNIGEVRTYRNFGVNPFKVLTSGGYFICFVKPSQVVTLVLVDNSTADGKWFTKNETNSCEPLQMVSIGTSYVLASTNASTNCETEILALDDSRYLAIFSDSGTSIKAVVCTVTSGSVVSQGTAVTVTTDGNPNTNIKADLLSNGNVVVSWANEGSASGRVLSITGSTITQGTILAGYLGLSYAGSWAANKIATAVIDSSKIAVFMYSGSDGANTRVGKAVILSISGTTLTANTSVNFSASSSAGAAGINYGIVGAFLVSSTELAVVYTQGTDIVVCGFTFSGTTLTVLSNIQSIFGFTGTTTLSYAGVVRLSPLEFVLVVKTDTTTYAGISTFGGSVGTFSNGGSLTAPKLYIDTISDSTFPLYNLRLVKLPNGQILLGYSEYLSGSDYFGYHFRTLGVQNAFKTVYNTVDYGKVTANAYSRKFVIGLENPCVNVNVKVSNQTKDLPKITVSPNGTLGIIYQLAASDCRIIIGETCL